MVKDLDQFYHLHSKGSATDKSRTWSICIWWVHIFFVKCKCAPLDALFSVWSIQYCSTKKSHCNHWLQLRVSLTLTLSHSVERIRQNWLVIWCLYCFNTIVLWWISKLLMKSLCLRCHRFNFPEIQDWRTKQIKMGNSNYIGTRINTTSIKRIYEHCDPETETEIKSYHFYVQLLQTWKAFHQLNDRIKINKIWCDD
jgi:hypothetical protein